MLYYRVKPQYDNYTRYYYNSVYQVKPNGFLVANELYTPCERANIANAKYFFDEVEIKKSNVYFFFGARFEKK